jgi:hypothetical protein
LNNSFITKNSKITRLESPRTSGRRVRIVVRT